MAPDLSYTVHATSQHVALQQSPFLVSTVVRYELGYVRSSSPVTSRLRHRPALYLHPTRQSLDSISFPNFNFRLQIHRFSSRHLQRRLPFPRKQDMSPRGRKGEMRMDAALDALVPMGFQKADIRKTVNKLLKVYGGAAGYQFIEEGSYKLLIETLLGVDDGSEPGPPLLTNEAVNEDSMHGDAGSSSAAGTGSSSAAETPLLLMDAEKTCADCGSHQDLAVTNEFSLPRHGFQSHTVTPPPPTEPYHVPPPPPPPEPYIVLPPPPPPPPPPAAGPAIPLLTNISPPKRKPCYGWLAGDSDDFMCVPLMPARRRKSSGQQRNRRP